MLNLVGFSNPDDVVLAAGRRRVETTMGVLTI